jgi:hypothetical protein
MTIICVVGVLTTISLLLTRSMMSSSFPAPFALFVGLLGLSVFIMSSSAEAAEGTTPNTPNESATLLTTIQQKIDKPQPVFKSTFTQTRQLVGVKKLLTEEGFLLVDKARGVIWETEKPLLNTVRITKDEIRLTSNGEVLSDMNANEEPVVGIVSNMLFAMFSGNLAALQNFFNVEGRRDGDNWQLNFTPKEKGLAQVIRSLTLIGDDDVRQVIMVNASGDRSEIKFSHTQYFDRLSADDAKLFQD